MSRVPVFVRGCAPRTLRRNRVVVALALPLCVAAPAVAEEPGTPPAAGESPSADAESTPSEQQVSEAARPESQGVVAPNFAPPVENPPRLAPRPPAPAPRQIPASAESTRGSPNGTLLGLRLPAFIALGIGGLGAGGAVVTHLAATAPYTDPKLNCNGRCADGAHMLGMTSTILAGLAVGALGTGVVLALSEPAREKKPLAPVLKVSVSPIKAAASASWRF